MNTVVASAVARLALGPAQVHRNIAVFPLLGLDAGPAPYLTLSEAIAARCIIVTEVSNSGSVPELRVVSQSDRPILLIDGEELIGAKQNRVLNTTILLKEKAETIIPVSCVEQGRWSYASAEFAASNTVMSRTIRMLKLRSVSDALDAEGKFRADQGKVWHEIERLQRRAGVTSATGAMQDVFRALSDDLAACEKAFMPVAGQTGIIVVIDGNVAGFDAVAHADAYAKLHPKLVRSYLVDALIERKTEQVDATKSAATAQAFLGELLDSQEKSFRSIGYGTDYRYQKPGMAGSALVHEERLVHMAFFRMPESESANSA
ncbi:MAG: ARPP-1 family domain-containing protein, partial [Verrucomicrobiia bacterium]